MDSSANISTPPVRLYRSSTDKVIAGVCGGLAAYFRIDPAIVRLAFLLFALAGGASILLYIVLWIAVPQGNPSAAPVSAHTAEITSFALIGVGIVWLLANIGVLRFVNWSVGWPLVLIVVGVALLLRRTA